MEEYILTHPWLASLLWMILYSSDYYLTLWGARLSRKQNIVEIEGSYELNPSLKKDVDNQNLLSFTFILWLITGSVLLYIAKPSAYFSTQPYSVLVGALLLPEIWVHKRHIKNIYFYRSLLKNPSYVSGQIRYSNRFIYRISAVEIMLYAVLLFLVFLLTYSWMFLGGAINTIIIAMQHWHVSNKQMPPSKSENAQEVSINPKAM